MLPVVAALLNSGLSLLGNAVLAKGKDVIEEKLGVDLEESVKTEEGIQILRNLEIREKEMLLSFVLEQMRLDNANVADARQLQVNALKTDDTLARNFIYYYTMFWALVSTCYIGFITFGNIPAQNVRFADTILGFVLGTLMSAPIVYFYGSTVRNRGKDNTIAKLVEEKKSGID